MEDEAQWELTPNELMEEANDLRLKAVRLEIEARRRQEQKQTEVEVDSKVEIEEKAKISGTAHRVRGPVSRNEEDMERLVLVLDSIPEEKIIKLLDKLEATKTRALRKKVEEQDILGWARVAVERSDANPRNALSLSSLEASRLLKQVALEKHADRCAGRRTVLDEQASFLAEIVEQLKEVKIPDTPDTRLRRDAEKLESALEALALRLDTVVEHSNLAAKAASKALRQAAGNPVE